MESEVWRRSVADLNRNLQVCATTLQTLSACIADLALQTKTLCDIQEKRAFEENVEAGENQENSELKPTQTHSNTSLELKAASHSNNSLEVTQQDLQDNIGDFQQLFFLFASLCQLPRVFTQSS